MSDRNPTRSNKTRLTDADKMFFGKFRGQPLGEVPDRWFRWFLQQPWANRFPDLMDYARICEDGDDDND